MGDDDFTKAFTAMVQGDVEPSLRGDIPTDDTASSTDPDDSVKPEPNEQEFIAALLAPKPSELELLASVGLAPTQPGLPPIRPGLGFDAARRRDEAMFSAVDDDEDDEPGWGRAVEMNIASLFTPLSKGDER